MSERFLKIFKKMDVKEVHKHLLIYGDLAGQCSSCQAMDMKLDMTACPKCGTDFKYIAFRNIKNHMPKILKINEERPHIVFIDHDDFKRIHGALKAQEFLK